MGRLFLLYALARLGWLGNHADRRAAG